MNFQLMITEFNRRVFAESYPRIEKCLNELSGSQIWHRQNENTSSVGNLVLHLCGNARQWMIAGLGGEKDIRKRSEEFSEIGPIPKGKLMESMSSLKTDINKVLETLNEGSLSKIHRVQGFNESGLAIFIHVIEHFSYHTGQITLHTKILKNIDTGYYRGVQLEP